MLVLPIKYLCIYSYFIAERKAEKKEKSEAELEDRKRNTKKC